MNDIAPKKLAGNFVIFLMFLKNKKIGIKMKEIQDNWFKKPCLKAIRMLWNSPGVQNSFNSKFFNIG